VEFYFVTVNANQDEKIAGKIGGDLMIRYEESNLSEHKEIKESIIRFEDKVEKKFDRLEEKIDKNQEEIKELLR